LSITREDELYLSIFLRYNSEVLIFKILDNKFQDIVYRTKIEAEFVNDISYSENNIFVCFDSSTIARIYPSMGDSDDEEDEEEEAGFHEDPMEQVE